MTESLGHLSRDAESVARQETVDSGQSTLEIPKQPHRILVYTLRIAFFKQKGPRHLLIHPCKRICASLLVTLLFVTQSLAPLIHAHGGNRESLSGLHLPGFEKVSLDIGHESFATAQGFGNFGFEVIVHVASGIETKADREAFFAWQNFFAPGFCAMAIPFLVAAILSIRRAPDFFLSRTRNNQRSRAPPRRFA